MTMDISQSAVWISPEGEFYNGDAHENRAEEILAALYGITNPYSAGDQLEELGWIRATTSLMWDIRADSDYWKDRHLTQAQYNALAAWCEFHKKLLPQKVKENIRWE